MICFHLTQRVGAAPVIGTWLGIASFVVHIAQRLQIRLILEHLFGCIDTVQRAVVALLSRVLLNG